MREWNGRVALGLKEESNEKDILIEGVIIQFGRNLGLREIPINSGE